ncbi:Asp/Glu racemase [Actinomadura rayongensis]|uniref:Asp/Glu racemase n=1 Tax=Actinomadura rayongensis TaxID=1429076 RepID=A0A6I4W0P4_9ACTN|nr:Asp/Glu racemase [Actinomadura rayongensis]
MRITLVNPNTTRAMTEAAGRAARAVAAPGTVVTAVEPATGPAAVESHHDAALAVPGVLAEVAAAPDADGFVLACFGDPGLDAAREVASGPVVGIAEAALHTATLLGRGFSVVTTLPRMIGRTEELVRRYGCADACRGVRACDVPVLDVSGSYDAVLDACAAALAADGSDVLVLGCAGMAELAAAVSAELGVPVVDGVAAATKLVEGLVAQGLRTSRRSEYAPVPGLVRALSKEH